MGKNSNSIGNVFNIGHDKINFVLFAQIAEAICQQTNSRAADNITNHQNFHSGGTNQVGIGEAIKTGKGFVGLVRDVRLRHSQRNTFGGGSLHSAVVAVCLNLFFNRWVTWLLSWHPRALTSIALTEYGASVSRSYNIGPNEQCPSLTLQRDTTQTDNLQPASKIVT